MRLLVLCAILAAANGLGETQAAPRVYSLALVTQRFDALRDVTAFEAEMNRLSVSETRPSFPIFVLPWESLSSPRKSWQEYHKVVFLYEEVKAESQRRRISAFVRDRIFDGIWVVIIGNHPVDWLAKTVGNPYLVPSPAGAYVEFIAARCDKDDERTICTVYSSSRSLPTELDTPEQIFELLKKIQFSLPAR